MKRGSLAAVLVVSAVILAPLGFIIWFGYSFSPGGGRREPLTAWERIAIAKKRAKVNEPDSIHVVKLPDNKEIRQIFGPGTDITYSLMDISGKEPKQLDEISSLRGDDSYVQPKITYDTANDWFVFSSTDSGSNDYLQQTTYVRVEGDHFHELIAFPADQSRNDTEVSPVRIQAMQVKVIEASKQQLVLTANYSDGTVNVKDIVEKQQELKDRAVFVYDKSNGKFVFQRSDNPKFKLVWEDKEYYPE